MEIIPAPLVVMATGSYSIYDSGRPDDTNRFNLCLLIAHNIATRPCIARTKCSTVNDISKVISHRGVWSLLPRAAYHKSNIGTVKALDGYLNKGVIGRPEHAGGTTDMAESKWNELLDKLAIDNDGKIAAL
jgi:hypothetical protein